MRKFSTKQITDRVRIDWATDEISLHRVTTKPVQYESLPFPLAATQNPPPVAT